MKEAVRRIGKKGISILKGRTIRQLKREMIEKAEIVSFDIFDTLIVRNCIEPHEVFDIVEFRYNRENNKNKIEGFRRYRLEAEKEARKKQKTVDIKELRLSPSIDTHDVQVKVRKAIEFLKNGDKVKISIRFRGREIGHSKSATIILENFARDVEEYGVIDKPPKMEAKSLVMFLAPKN